FLTSFSTASTNRGVSCRGSNVGAFGFQDKGFSTALAPPVRATCTAIQTRRLPTGRPENVVPQWRADAVPDVIIFVVMAKMVLLQPEEYAAFHRKMVRRIMQHVVTDIAKHQSGERARREAPEH